MRLGGGQGSPAAPDRGSRPAALRGPLAGVGPSPPEKEPTAPVVEPPPLTPEAALAQRLEQGWTSVTPGLRGMSVAVLTRVSKSFMAALVLKLAEEGRLDLDDALTEHWLDCPVPWG